MLAEEFLHLLFGINLPIPEITRRLSHARGPHRTGGSRQRENIRQRMCGIGGEQQDPLSPVPLRQAGGIG